MSPPTERLVSAVRPITTPSCETRYPETRTLSVAGDHVRSSPVRDGSDCARSTGGVGASASARGQAAVRTQIVARGESRRFASTARTENG